MLRTAVTSIAACAHPHWLVSPGHAYRSRNLCVIVTERIDAHVGMSGSKAAGEPCENAVVSEDATELPARAGTTAATENAFRNSLLCSLSILVRIPRLMP